MKRVVIVGSPGSGKTTFAKQLAGITGLPLVHLDYFFHQTEHNYIANKDAWTEKINELISKDSWIIDGNYSSTFSKRMKRADTIIFLDPPRWVSLWGITKRLFFQRDKQRTDMPSEWEDKFRPDFFKYVWHFNRKSRHKIIDAIKTHRNKEVIALKSRKQAQKFLNSLAKSSDSNL